MSKQIHDEGNRRKQINFRADRSLHDDLKEVADARGVNLSDLLREAAQAVVDRHRKGDSPEDAPLDVPRDDPDLARAYRWLVDHAAARGARKRHDDGHIPEYVVTNRLSQEFGWPEQGVWTEVLRPLEARGYVSIVQGAPSHQASGSRGSVQVHEIRQKS